MEHTTRASANRAWWAARIVVVLAALTGLGFVAPARAPAAPNKPEVTAVTTQTSALAPGQSAWVSVVWSASQTVTNWSTTVSAPTGITITYPATRGGSDTSLYGSSTLVGTTRDFTSFRVSVPYTQTQSFQVTLRSTYDSDIEFGNGNGGANNGNHSGNSATQGNNGNSGGKLATSATVSIPIVAATGPKLTLNTATLSIQSGSNDYHQFTVTAGQTDLSNVTLALGTPPSGLEVTYPGDRQSAGLNGGPTLAGASTDYASVRLTATHLRPGTYNITVILNYSTAAAATMTGRVTLLVT